MSNDLNELFELAYGHITAKAIHIATNLNLHIVLDNNPNLSISQLAMKLNFDPIGLTKLLKILDSHGIILIDSNQTIKPTTKTYLLEYIDTPHISLNYKAIDYFQKACQINNETFSEAYDEGFYSYIKNNNLTEKFKVWCTKTAEIWLSSVLKQYDFSKAKHIVDLGSGEGYLAGLLLKKYHTLEATLIDTPEILDDSIRVIEKYGVSKRAHITPGDFFDANTLPNNKDIYILCRTLLNWSNEDACNILDVCNKVMGNQSKLLVIDFYIPDKTHSAYKRSLLSDAALFVTFNSANRTIAEWKQLISKSSLKINKIYLEDKQLNPEPIMPFFVMELVK